MRWSEDPDILWVICIVGGILIVLLNVYFFFSKFFRDD